MYYHVLSNNDVIKIIQITFYAIVPVAIMFGAFALRDSMHEYKKGIIAKIVPWIVLISFICDVVFIANKLIAYPWNIAPLPSDASIYRELTYFSNGYPIWGWANDYQLEIVNHLGGCVCMLGWTVYAFCFMRSNTSWWKKICKFIAYCLISILITGFSFHDFNDLWIYCIFILLAIVLLLLARVKNHKIVTTNTVPDVISNEEATDNKDNKNPSKTTKKEDDESNQNIITTDNINSEKQKLNKSRLVTINLVLLHMKRVFNMILGVIIKQWKIVIGISVGCFVCIGTYVLIANLNEMKEISEREKEIQLELAELRNNTDENKTLKLSIEKMIENCRKAYAGGIDYNTEIFEQALENIISIARNGNSKAQYILGHYYKGTIYPKSEEYCDPITFNRIDKTKAAYWLLEAAKKGHKSAQYDIGGMYLLGYTYECNDETITNGINRNVELGLQWCKKASANGDSKASLFVGDLYLDPVSALQSFIEAKKSYRLYNCDDFNIIETNIDSAFYYWEKAKEQGLEKEASERLERIYE